MKISTPEIKVIRFSSEDVIVASGSLTGKSGSFYIPSSQYSGYSTSSDFVEFKGTIGSQSAVGYLIENVSGVKDPEPDAVEGLMSGGKGGFYFSSTGIPVPASVLEPIAKQYYEAFSYNGQYYTNGTFYDHYWQ